MDTLNRNVKVGDGRAQQTVLLYELHGVALVFYALGHIKRSGGSALPQLHS